MLLLVFLKCTWPWCGQGKETASPVDYLAPANLKPPLRHSERVAANGDVHRSLRKWRWRSQEQHPPENFGRRPPTPKPWPALVFACHHPNFFAPVSNTVRRRSFFKFLRRNSNGSIFTSSASSSINDSRAKWFAVAARARYEPCRKGDRAGWNW